MSDSRTTTDHDTIRRWAEERDGHPAAVRKTGSGDDPGILRFDFGEPEESLERIPWDEFFAKFDEQGLALLHQDKTKNGATSRFFKFVKREGGG